MNRQTTYELLDWLTEQDDFLFYKRVGSCSVQVGVDDLHLLVTRYWEGAEE